MRHRIAEALELLVARLQQLRLPNQFLIQGNHSPLGLLLLRDVERDAQQQRWLATLVSNRHLERVRRAAAVIAGIDLLLRDFADVAAGEGLAILGGEMIRLIFGEKVIVVAPEQSIAAVTDDLLRRAID